MRSTGVNARVQTTSIAREMKPVAKRMEAISGERSAEPAAAGASAIAAGRGPGLVPASFALTAATAKFSATATQDVRCSPRISISTAAVASVPSIAPITLAR